MIEINMKNITSKIIGINDNISKNILNSLTYEVSENRFKKSKKYLFNPSNGITYTGLVPHIVRLLKSNNMPFKINDLREKPESGKFYKLADGFKPRDYQKELIDKVTSRSIICAATGAGKTCIMACLIEKYNVKYVTMLVPTVSLAVQNAREIGKFLGIDVGIYCGQIKEIRDITICTPESAPEFLLKRTQMLLVDEVHCIAAETMFNCSNKCTNAYYRFGCSASPWRDDGKDLLLEAAINIRKPSLYINASKLIKIGKLTPCEINFIDINQQYDFNGDYQQLYDEAIVNNRYRNQIIVNKAIEHYKNNDSILILFKNIKHGKLLYNMIVSEIGKEKVALVDGSVEIDEREIIFEKTRKGEIKILIGSSIADTGLDIPILNVLILAAGGKSSIKAFQRIGRVIRLYPGKNKAIIYDFNDHSQILYNHSQERKSLYSLESEWKIN